MKGKCPHCDQPINEEKWPFCAYCLLFLVSEDELDLSPRASVTVWRKEVKVEFLN